jgi:hypothetical protein
LPIFERAADFQARRLFVQFLAGRRFALADLVGLFAERRLGFARQVFQRFLTFGAGLRFFYVAPGGGALFLGCHAALLPVWEADKRG